MTDQTKTKRLLLPAMLMLSTLLIVLPAQAADTGLKSPTSYTTGATANDPTDPQQACVDDVTVGSTNDSLCARFKTDNTPSHVADSEIYYNFGFSIPSGATIDGIEVVVSGYRTGGPSGVPGAYFSVRLNGGAGWTDYQNTLPLSLADALYTLGTSDPLWGKLWTADSFSNANFGLEILAGGPSNTGEHWKLDSVSVKVYYTSSASPGGFEVGDYCTYTQGGWGGPGNPGQILSVHFTAIYPSGVEVGIPGASGYSMIFESATNVNAYLPAGGTPGALTEDLLNPTSDDSSGVFGGQVLALQLNVDFSAAGITQGPGGPVGDLVLCDTGTSLDGSTIAEILEAANTALGGGALPEGYTIDDLNGLVDNLNKAFDNGVPSSWAQDHLCS